MTVERALGDRGLLPHRRDQARSAARELLGDLDGLLITDRYSVYDFIDPERRQVCLSHLARNFQAFAERHGAPGRHGQNIKPLIEELIRADTKARHDGERLAWDQAPLNDVHDRLLDAVEAGERSHTPDHCHIRIPLASRSRGYRRLHGSSDTPRVHAPLALNSPASR